MSGNPEAPRVLRLAIPRSGVAESGFVYALLAIARVEASLEPFHLLCERDRPNAEELMFTTWDLGLWPATSFSTRLGREDLHRSHVILDVSTHPEGALKPHRLDGSFATLVTTDLLGCWRSLHREVSLVPPRDPLATAHAIQEAARRRRAPNDEPQSRAPRS